jgi:hypothetical protein
VFTRAYAFQSDGTRPCRISRRRVSSLNAFKGGKAQNKQAELAKKLASASSTKKSDTNINKYQEDYEEFAKLLETTKGAIPRDVDKVATVAFIPDIKAGTAKAKVKKPKPDPHKPIPSIDPDEEKVAHRVHFEKLIDIESSTPLGPIRAAQLVPWVPPFLSDYLIAFVDPRLSSGDLRQTVKYLIGESDAIFITADSPSEIKSWRLRNQVAPSTRIFSDQALEWMTAYNIVGAERWSLAMIVFDTNGAIQRLERNVDPSRARQLVQVIIQENSSKSTDRPTRR